MLAQIATAYILGIFAESVFNIDFYSIAFLYIMSFIILLTMKGFSKRHYVFYAILLISFSFSVFYTRYELRSSQNVSYPNSLYEITGKIVEVDEAIGNKKLTIETENIVDLTRNESLLYKDKYIKVLVSPSNHSQLYDEVSFQNDLQEHETNSYIENTKLFTFDKYENIFYNAKQTVSFPSEYKILSSKKNLYETTILKTFEIKNGFIENINRSLGEPYASVANGITYGSTGNLIKDIKDIFKNSGLIHILVLSGTNVSFIILVLYFSLGKIDRRLRVILTLIFAWTFIGITGLNLPALRAGIMATGTILGEYFSQKTGALFGLILSLFVLSLVNPLSILYNTSLHLSYLASIAVFILVPIFNKILEENKYYKITNNLLRNFVSISFAILISVDPYVLTLSQNIPILGTLLTLVIEPFIFLGMILSLIISIIPVLPISILDILCMKIILGFAELGNFLTPQFGLSLNAFYIKIYYMFYFIFLYFIIKKYE